MFYRMLTTGRLPEEETDWEPPSSIHPDLDENWGPFCNPGHGAGAGEPVFPRRPGHGSGTAGAVFGLDGGKWITSAACPPSPADGQTPVPPEAGLRKIPVKTGTKNPRRFFSLDELWRPVVYTANDFIAAGPAVLADPRHRPFCWQRSGSRHPLTWHQADQYVEGLNAAGFGGSRRWRLPTVAELATLLKPAPRGKDFCIAADFDACQKWLWSSDRRSFTSAWYASVDTGFIAWQDLTCCYYARAVCDASQDTTSVRP